MPHVFHLLIATVKVSARMLRHDHLEVGWNADAAPSMSLRLIASTKR